VLSDVISSSKPRNLTDLRGCILAGGCDFLFGGKDGKEYVPNVTEKQTARDILEAIVENQLINMNNPT